MMKPFDELQYMKTLLIDDDEFVRDSMRLLFESRNCFLTAVGSAEEGIKALEIDQYNIIITDYKLPGINGIDFCKHVLRNHSLYRIILITAYGSREVAHAARAIGVEEFLEKPITTKSITASLSRLVNRST